MDNNYKKTIVESIDMESKCFKGKNGKCALLTEDGWCNIVKYCGDEYLSKTCSIFPRRVVSYGDIIERCFEPVCPVIAKKMVTDDIDFSFLEIEIPNESCDMDYRIYDNLSYVRSYLVDFLQNNIYRNLYANFYIMYKIIYDIRNVCIDGEINKDNIYRIIERYEDANNEAIYDMCIQLEDKYSENKFIMGCDFARYMEEVINIILKKYFQKSENYISEFKEFWSVKNIKNGDLIENFKVYYRKNYNKFFTNFFVYSLFCDLVVKDIKDFGKKIEVRYMEYIIIQMIAVFEWSSGKEISYDDYAVIVAAVDRVMSHDKGIYNSIKFDEFLKIEKLLLLFIC